jgi:hypothetical protein
MVLTAEQDAKFRQKCAEIKPGEYGEVVVSFYGEPTNIVQITGKQSTRFHDGKPTPTQGEPQDRKNSGRIQ